METLYYYKLTVDDGGAPCIADGLLSLAICKPFIRTKAQQGSIIFGFAANSLAGTNPLLYIAVVTDVAQDGTYYTEKEYSGRADCVYTRKGGRFAWRSGAHYHGPNDLAHDLGTAPGYPRARVLLSKDFRYLGNRCSADYKSKYPAIKAAVEGLGQGHRVNHPAALRDQLLRLKDEVWSASSKKTLGVPLLTPDNRHCHRERSCGSC
jgi:hypothetical protein